MENSFFMPQRSRKSKVGVVLAMVGLAALVGVVCYMSFKPSGTELKYGSGMMITEDEKEFMHWM